MKIFVIHGDDTQKSYSRLIQFINSAKKRGWEVVYIEGDSSNSLRDVLSTPSLFGDERFFVIKDVKRIDDRDIEWVNKSEKISGNLVLYSDKKILTTLIKKFQKIEKIEEFSLPFLVFKFLDYLYPNNLRQVLSTFKELLDSQAPEFLFSLISKHFRDMYWTTLKDKPSYPSWRLEKITRQATKFKSQDLRQILNDLAKIDFKSKTGQANMAEELDLLLVTKLK